MHQGIEQNIFQLNSNVTRYSSELYYVVGDDGVPCDEDRDMPASWAPSWEEEERL